MDSATISTNSQERYPEQEAYATGTVVTFVALVVGIFSNVIFLSMLMVCTDRQTRLRLFLMHLGVANLFVCFFTIAFELGWRLTTSWMAGDTVCRVLSLTKTLGLYAQSYVVVAMTVDHYYTVMWPKHTKSQSQRAKNLLAMAWAAASVFSIPQVTHF
jgi:7 transmembrane receptor (rhodopsin family)